MNGPVIGFADGFATTDKRQREIEVFQGLWLLRLCTECGEVFSRSGAVDLLGDKVAVRDGNVTLFIEICADGCATTNLRLCIRAGEVLIKCNDCGSVVDGESTGKVLRAWEVLQRRKLKQKRGR